MTSDVKTKFTQQEAIAAILNATKDGELSLEDRVGLLGGIVREQQDQIAQEQQANAALLGWFKEFRGLVCNAARALSWPGADEPQWTFLEQPLAAEHHAHRSFGPDARAALAALAALDTSGYAPAPTEPYFAAEGGNRPEHSVGAGPRRELP